MFQVEELYIYLYAHYVEFITKNIYNSC